MVVGVGINTLASIAQVDGTVSASEPLSFNVPHTTIAKSYTVPQIFQVFWKSVKILFSSRAKTDHEEGTLGLTYLLGHRILGCLAVVRPVLNI